MALSASGCRSAALLLSFLLLPVPVWAQSTASDGCLWDGSDTCEAERAARVEAIYGLPPVERLAAAGVRVRRAFFVDGHQHIGREFTDLGAVSFTRAAGQPPIVSFSAPREHGVTHPPISAEVPAAAWDEVLALSAYFDRGPGPTANAICLHPWEYNVEVADPPDTVPGGHGALVRRRYDNHCNEHSYTVAYAEVLMAVAAGLFPDCVPLGPDHYDFPILFLRDCALLSGDRRTAAEAYVVLAGLNRSNDDEQPDRIEAAFAEDVSLDWDGRRVSGRAAAARRWRAETGRNQRLLRWDRVEATGPDRAEAGGVIAFLGGGRWREAPVTVQAARGSDGRLVVASAVVGRFIPAGHSR